ncbi:hypothetical protein K505DRAFT_120094 [Melanomma pulvis-pyrius CBS 109.77]|uniref:Uncharacterized protein n=1 Tax=Melanomma pulvis-pyrius CBS 109.77 TaxID=1314802 RepID=A0A6A6WUJ3_9PLEO|nr:hypothetical protein K505DRAFT_120094 [Melanomma pulvis-pyrius CBS 109.77]
MAGLISRASAEKWAANAGPPNGKTLKWRRMGARPVSPRRPGSEAYVHSSEGCPCILRAAEVAGRWTRRFLCSSSPAARRPPSSSPPPAPPPAPSPSPPPAPPPPSPPAQTAVASLFVALLVSMMSARWSWGQAAPLQS